MPRNPIEKCEVTWEERYGTTVSGNLSRYKITECIDGMIDLAAIWAGGATWVRNSDFHYHHLKCPYSTEASLHYVRNLDKSSPHYWELELVVNTAAHTATSGMMIKYSKGSKHGWLCVDPNCPYFLSTGMRYFYL